MKNQFKKEKAMQSEFETLTQTKIEANSLLSFFIPNLDGGGAERVMLHLAEGCAERGLRADLVVAQAKGAYLGNIPSTVRLINLEATSPLLLTKTIALKKYLEREQPTALLTTLDIFNAAAWAQRLAKTPTRSIMVVQTHLSQQFQDRHSLPMRWLKCQIVRLFYPWSHQIVAASQGVADDLENIAGISTKTTRVIYNPVVKPDFFEKVKQPIAHPWFDSEAPPVILGVGRLVKQKDFATLVRAFAKVRQVRTCRLIILGDVDEREPNIKPELEALIEKFNIRDDVLLPGFVENPYAYMANSQIFALSSIYEGFGNVVAEAIAAGTSVVSTDCESGPAEILENGKCGRLVSVRDHDALAMAILETLDNPIDSVILAERAKAFTVEVIVDQYLDIITNALSKSSSKPY